MTQLRLADCASRHWIRGAQEPSLNQLMIHVFRWRSRSSQIASGVKGLSMSTWTDCGYPRGSWAAIGLNPRRESPSGWGPFVETVGLVFAIALTGCVGSSGSSKLGLVRRGWYLTCLAEYVSGTRWVSQPHVGASAGHFGYRRDSRLMSRERQSNHSAPICLLCHVGAGS